MSSSSVPAYMRLVRDSSRGIGWRACWRVMDGEATGRRSQPIAERGRALRRAHPHSAAVISCEPRYSRRLTTSSRPRRPSPPSDCRRRRGHYRSCPDLDPELVHAASAGDLAVNGRDQESVATLPVDRALALELRPCVGHDQPLIARAHEREVAGLRLKLRLTTRDRRAPFDTSRQTRSWPSSRSRLPRNQSTSMPPQASRSNRRR